MNEEYEALRLAAADVALEAENGDHCFEVLAESHYQLSVPALESTIEVNRIHSKGEHTHGEVRIACAIQGAKTVGSAGLLSYGTMNLTSERVRNEKSRFLAERSGVSSLEWLNVLQILGFRVMEAERRGAPPVQLRDLPRPSTDPAFMLDGFTFPRKHPTIVFGDGGSAKSYFALYVLGKLSISGAKVALFDWEMGGEDHRERLERLFGHEMPEILYCRCERPLVHEIDRLAGIVRREKINYVVLDSIAFACDGPPESAEIAGKYFRAVRQLKDVGSMHIAHINKSDNAEHKPFGSIFWHNGARSTWFVRYSEGDTGSAQLGLFNRKTNHGPLSDPRAFDVSFEGESTLFSRADPTDTPGFNENASVRLRISNFLRGGPASMKLMSSEMDIPYDTIQRTVRRSVRSFVRLPNGQIGLKAHGH